MLQNIQHHLLLRIMQEKLNLVKSLHLRKRQVELIRGWYSFSHTAFALFFFFGHLWHASRAVFQDLWTGLSVTIESLHQVEYGRNEKLGDKTSQTSTFL